SSRKFRLRRLRLISARGTRVVLRDPPRTHRRRRSLGLQDQDLLSDAGRPPPTVHQGRVRGQLSLYCSVARTRFARSTEAASTARGFSPARRTGAGCRASSGGTSPVTSLAACSPHGFARLACLTCRAEVLVPFSCKSRGVCPS